MKYRHKPTIIEAMHWDGNFNVYEQMFEWSGGGIILNTVNNGIRIQKTGLVLLYGQWLIKRDDGELYPCDNSTFQSSYEQILEVQEDDAEVDSEPKVK